MRNAPQFNVNGVWVLQSDTSTQRSEIYNNTFHGGGKCWLTTGPAVVVEPGAHLDSLRSNAFVDFATNLGPDTAMVRGGGVERGSAPGQPVNEPKDPPLQRLGYADYTAV